MDRDDLREILKAVAEKEMSPEDAEHAFQLDAFTDKGFVKIDNQRGLRQGVAEVVYGEGKMPEHLKAIVETMKQSGQKRILITRLTQEKARYLSKYFEFSYHEQARIAVFGPLKTPKAPGSILVAAAGTSDIPVAEEAAVTAEFLGNTVNRVYDVGVAGLHRLFAHSQDIINSKVIIAVAGMEGALPSVIAGMADCPVLAVPTSVGYGASFGGVAALLAMLNSCASGVSVVNIDNGFGAGFQASLINQLGNDRGCLSES